MVADSPVGAIVGTAERARTPPAERGAQGLNETPKLKEGLKKLTKKVEDEGKKNKATKEDVKNGTRSQQRPAPLLLDTSSISEN